MAKRKAYKALYLAEEHHRQVAQAERDAYKRELREYQEALAPYGQKTLQAIPDNTNDRIDMKPMEFVAMKSFMELNSRLAPEVPEHVVPLSYSWRGRPIHRA